MMAEPIVIPRMFHENVCTSDTIAYEAACDAIRYGSIAFQFSTTERPRDPDWLDRVREALSLAV